MASLKDYYDSYYEQQIAGTGPDPATEPTFHKRVNFTLTALAGTKRVLDFGCGIGQASRIFAANGHDVVGVDISQPAVEYARKIFPEMQFETISAEDPLPFPDRYFDACFCSEVIEHLFDVRRFLEEMARVLVPGGLLILTTPYHGLLKNFLISAFGFERHFDPTGEHIRFFTEKSLRRCLEEQGFSITNRRGIGRWAPLWKSLFVVARSRQQ